MTKKTALLLGASSDTGLALANLLASEGWDLLLAARDTTHLEGKVKTGAGSTQQFFTFNAKDFQKHESWFNTLPEVPDLTICVFGYLGDQAKAESEWAEAQSIIDSNYTGAVSILNVIANVYSKRKSGTIVGFSSVAGERGRQSNFIYGSAKAGFTAYLSGLRNRLFKDNVHVVTILPGFMNTKMTAGLNLPKPLTAEPAQVARYVWKAVNGKKNVVYILPIWFLIMWIIKSIPEFIFKRLKM